MSIIRTNRKTDFTVIPNAVINDADLSGDELGLLVFLLSKPADWWITIDSLKSTQRFGSHGKLVVSLKKLRALGYAHLKRLRSGKTEWVITDERGTQDVAPHSENQNVVTEPHSENPHSENPNSENRNVLQKKDLNKELSETKNGEIPPLPPKKRNEAFESFYAEYPRKIARKAAEKAWEKLMPTKQLVGEIMDGLRRGIDSVEWAKDGGEYIPHPASFLNGERWTDEFKEKPLGATNQSPEASSSTARSMRGHYEQDRVIDKSAPGRTRRDCERWLQDQDPGTNEPGSVLEGQFETVSLRPALAAHG